MKKSNLHLALFVLSVAFSSCEKIVGRGPLVTETRSATSFNGLEVSIPGETYFTQDSVYKLELQAQQNVLDEIETVVINNALRIRFRNPNTRIRTHDGITVRVSAPDIRSLWVDGSGNLLVNGPFTPANINLEIEGSGYIRVQDISTSVISTEIDGSGNILIANGMANEATAKIEGSGQIDVAAVQVKNADARIDGSGTIKVFATENLKARIEGSGSILYKGAPAISTHITGSGTVTHL